jgi:hypothetical protein
LVEVGLGLASEGLLVGHSAAGLGLASEVDLGLEGHSAAGLGLVSEDRDLASVADLAEATAHSSMLNSSPAYSDFLFFFSG